MHQHSEGTGSFSGTCSMCLNDSIACPASSLHAELNRPLSLEKDKGTELEQWRV
jgi:hypothetical protein